MCKFSQPPDLTFELIHTKKIILNSILLSRWLNCNMIAYQLQNVYGSSLNFYKFRLSNMNKKLFTDFPNLTVF